MNKNKKTWIIIIAVIIIAVLVYVAFFTGEAILPAWSSDDCKMSAPCLPAKGDCDRDADCLTGYCKDRRPQDDICACREGTGWNEATQKCETWPAGQITDSETFVCVPGV